MKIKIWAIAVPVFIVVLLVLLVTKERFQTDMLMLLPSVSGKTADEHSLDDVTAKLSRFVTILVGSSEAETSVKAADQVHQIMLQSSIFKTISYKVDSSISKDVFYAYFPYRFSLITQEDYQLLKESSDFNWLAIRMRTALASPVAGINSETLKYDPFLFFSNYMQHLPSRSKTPNISSGTVHMQDKGKDYILISAQLKGSSFEQGNQETFKRVLNSIDRLKQQNYDLEILVSGVIRHAMENRRIAQNEISFISVGSVLGISLLLLVIFRNGRVIPIILIPSAVGMIAGLTVSILLFDVVHILTLVFGASLIGVSIDYALHYVCNFSQVSRHSGGGSALQSIFTALTLGLITTVIGYLSFFATQLLVFKQMAVFSASGLVAAYFTVIALFPALLRKPLKINILAAKRLTYFANNLQNYQAASLWMPIAAIAVLIGVIMVTKNPVDDIRLMRTSLPELEQIEKKVGEIIGGRPNSQFFLIAGKNDLELLSIEEKLSKYIKESLGKDQTGDFMALTQVVPSAKTQRDNYKILRERLLEEGGLKWVFSNLGLPSEIGDIYKKELENARGRILSLEKVLESPLGERYNELFISNQDGRVYSILVLFDITNLVAMEKIASQIDGVTLVDQVKQTSKVLQYYRQSIEAVAPYILSGLVFLLAFRYGVKLAIRIVAVPVIAALLSFVMVIGMNGQYNIFHILGMIVTIAIAFDYSIFTAEKKQENISTNLAITLSGLTTLLSFGLLTFSRTPALKAFGATILFGILFAYILTPLIIRPMENRKK